MPVEPPVVSPHSLAEALDAVADGRKRPIAGGTDLMVALTGELGEPPERMVDLWGLDELRGIAVGSDGIVLGALTTYTEIRRSALCREHLPGLVEAAATIGAAQIQNRGTLGGNIANASPAGDTLPVLLALDASFALVSAHGERTVSASEFWTGYRTTALAPDELVARIHIPFGPGREMRFRKVGTRRAQSISKVVMAVAWSDGAGAAAQAHEWRDVRVAVGSVAATTVRATATEAAMEGRAPNPETADLAAETLAIEQGVGPHLVGQAPVAIDIGEIKLSARLQQVVGAAQHRELVDAEIDHAVRHHHVEACRLEGERVELLEITLEKFDIGTLIAELPCVPVEMRPRGGQLLVGHVDAGDGALGPHQLGDEIGVTPRARAEIEHPAARQRRRDGDAATVIFGPHLLMHVGEQGFEMNRHAAPVATGGGLQILRAFQDLAVIVLHHFEIHGLASQHPK